MQLLPLLLLLLLILLSLVMICLFANTDTPRPAPRCVTLDGCCSLKVHRALVILEPVETDVESLRALVSLDGGTSTRSGECTWRWHENHGEGGVLIVMHGRSRITVDPRSPTMPGRSTPGFQ